MAQITRYPFFRHLRADAVSHIQFFHGGEVVRSGRGLSFWFLPGVVSISEVPTDDRALEFVLKGQSSDFQDLTIQGEVVWRVTDPECLGERIDFTINLVDGFYVGNPIDQVANGLVSRARQYANAYLKERSVRDLLDSGSASLQAALEAGFAQDDSLADIGLAIVAVSVANLAPSSELVRALQTPTFERLQQQADEATFARRALAVEKERAIAENELNNKIELAARQKDLIAREDENARSEAESRAAAIRIAAEAEADRIRAVDQAKADMEQARMSVYAGLSAPTLLAVAAGEFAAKLERIDNFTITPDMLAGILGQVKASLTDPMKT